jgi:hypothetical protein
MRSNNAFILLPYNIFEFSMLSEAVAAEVGLELGAMSYYAMSMHVYANDYSVAQKVIDADFPSPNKPIPVMPHDPSPLRQIQELVKLEVDARHAAAGFSGTNFEAKWLHCADEKLHPYWRQFYYLLLLAMCKKVEFQPGVAMLQEFIDDPWISCLPVDTFTTPPIPAHQQSVRELDLFGRPATPTSTREPWAPQPSLGRDRRAIPAGKVSKKDFQEGCRRILRQYVPPTEGRVLRSHYLDFIVRNQERAPEQRFRILEELRKYDISTSGSFQPHFNREPSLLAERKLRQVEQSAEPDKSAT